ncbi:MAG: (d)CMP kinase, partial [Pseudobdellovibrionaceae bacterium]
MQTEVNLDKKNLDQKVRAAEGGDMGIVVTVDGPAASGKSSLSRELARRMGWSWVS